MVDLANLFWGSVFPYFLIQSYGESPKTLDETDDGLLAREITWREFRYLLVILDVILLLALDYINSESRIYLSRIVLSL